MSKLESLEEQLYGKEKKGTEEIESRAKWRGVFPRLLHRRPTSWVDVPKPPEINRGPSRGRVRNLFVIGTIVLLMVLAGMFVFLYLGTRGQEAQVTIDAGETVESGAVFTVPITVFNISRTTLLEGQIVINPPPGAFLREGSQDTESHSRILKSIPALKPGERSVVEVSLRLFGKDAEEQQIGVSYQYRPENLGARFSAHAVHTVKIVKVPLSISWDIPETLSQGQDVDIKVHYISSGRLPFEHMALRMEYPPGFSFVSADPKATVGNNMWEIGELQSEREGIISLKGKITGEEGEIKAFRGGLGSFNALTKEWKPYIDSTREIKIAVTPLSVQGFINGKREGVVTPGQQTRIVINYRNNTQVPLKNITIRTYLTGSMLDIKTIEPEKEGVFDFASGAVVWGPGNVQELREVPPGGGGEIRLAVHMKDPPPVVSERDKDLRVTMRTTIGVASIPKELEGTDLTSQDTVEFKVASKVTFTGKSLYGSSPIPNTGPLPPQVGKTTFYTIKWEIRNFTSDLDNAEVVAALPANVAWGNVFLAEDSTIVYDPAFSQVRWHIGKIKAGTGVLGPALTGVFQISITPAEIDRGKSTKLINESVFKATDMFTQTPVEKKMSELSTELREDPSSKSQDWVVR